MVVLVAMSPASLFFFATATMFSSLVVVKVRRNLQQQRQGAATVGSFGERLIAFLERLQQFVELV